MPRLRALAIGGALLVLPATASAQAGLTERLRIQGGYTYVQNTQPPDDRWAGVAPELSYTVLEPLWMLRVTYGFAANVHTTFPVDISNRLSLASSFELSKRTSLLLNADATETTIASLLATQPANNAVIGALPPGDTHLLATNAAEGISYELGPVVTMTEGVNGSYVTSFGSGPTVDNIFGGAYLGLERLWKKDSLGLDGRMGYARTRTDPLPLATFYNASLAPKWRHDINRQFTASLSTGATIVWSPDQHTKPKLGPFIQASLLYAWSDSTLEGVYTTGFVPNQLTAQLLQSDQITIHATTLLSVRHHISGAASAGFVHGTLVNLRTDLPTPPGFNSYVADAELDWSPAEAVTLFTRYQFLDQITDQQANTTATPPIVRNAVIVGIQLSSRADDLRVPGRFPQRVDRGDAPGASAAPAESSSSTEAPKQ